ncbi:phosphofurin acidic cluster sorting protein 1-like [Uloborus diversus]|uniref:phosphofurin acidic cluster sorting protein 1-like n=1 Tax=Uloborus diversus TaxID=327109 RepID=UPI00240A0773|nr:phosphofurin acidic cluster sorting protein 1-like [Uloborus diversus]
MAEKSTKPSNVWGKPVPMKLFAAWEVDRTAPNCIPRLCTLNLTRLVLLKPVTGDVNSVIIAVKMQSSKRTLRSNEIMVLNNGLIDTELDLTFSLQYPHFLKRSGNNLQILLQRRKRYKNRAILGFKTLAGGIINMAEVLQRPMDKDLELHSNNKEKSEVMARVLMYAISSQPVDHEDADRQKMIRGVERVVEVDNFSDEEEEYTSNEDGCDSEPVAEETTTGGETIEHEHAHLRKSLNQKIFQTVAERPDPVERNIKQKIIALLKKFRIPEAEVSDSEQYQDELEQELISQNPQEFEDLIDELESMSDSGPDVDDISISSTPKPSLRPFFSSGTLTALDKTSMPMVSDDSSRKTDENHESGTDQENTDTSQTASPPKSLNMDEKKPFAHSNADKEKRTKLFTREKNASKDKRLCNSKEVKEKVMYEKSTSKDSECSPQKTVLEQLARIFPSDDSIPDHVLVINAIDVVGNCLAVQLLDREENVITILSNSDLRASFSCLMNKIQKFCNCNAHAPLPIKIGILGQDSFFSSVLRLYVEHFSLKPSEWQTYVKFCIVPLTSSCVAKHIGNIDNTYSNSFLDSSWKDLLDHCNETSSTPEIQVTVDRILHYINNSASLWQLAIAEAMVTYREKSSDDESSQIFIPFTIDVKIGMMEGVTQTASMDTEEISPNLTVPGGSPPSNTVEKGPRENTTPPSSPSISTAFYGNSSTPLLHSSNISTMMSGVGETVDLQLDYWILPQKGDVGKKGETSKLSLKTSFRTLHVSRVSGSSDAAISSLTLMYVTKEKKQKIMRLGKKKEKEKELDNRYQQVEGINRLICSCRTLQAPLKVTIDGVEWSGVKFFQLTSQWQTHVKYFPVAVFSMPEHP